MYGAIAVSHINASYEIVDDFFYWLYIWWDLHLHKCTCITHEYVNMMSDIWQAKHSLTLANGEGSANEEENCFFFFKCVLNAVLHRKLSKYKNVLTVCKCLFFCFFFSVVSFFSFPLELIAFTSVIVNISLRSDRVSIWYIHFHNQFRVVFYFFVIRLKQLPNIPFLVLYNVFANRLIFVQEETKLK